MTNVREIRLFWSTDTAGNPLALVIFNDRTCEYARHADVAGLAGYRTA